MSLFKMKRGQESKVSSLAKEDGSLIFSLNGANDSTVRLDQTVNGTVQRLGIAVDKAKSADSVIDYNEPTKHIKIGYAGAGLSTSNLNYIAGYTNNGTQIKDVSKDVLKSWLGVSDSDLGSYQKRYRNANAITTGGTDLNGTLPPAIFAYKNGYPLHTDPEFANSNNGINIYNNSGNGNVTIERIAMQNGNSSGYVLKVSNKGSASPGLGGWYFGDTTVHARQYTCIFRAKIPSGRNVQWASNAIGTNGTSFWLTDRAGTGKWEWYAYHVDCGSANFSSTNFFYIDGEVGTASAPVVWYLSYANTIINSWGNYDGLRTRYSDLATNSNALGGSSLSQVLASAGSGKFLPLAGGTMTGTITAAIGNQKGIKIGNQWITSASDTNGEVVLQGGHLRFGTTAWDYNQWAGLKYNHSNKGIYLGLADGTQFIANQPQSGGSIYTPGIDNIYVGASTSQKVLTTFNYTSTTDGRYVKKSGDIMTGALNLQSAFKGITTQTLSGNTIKTGNNNVTITLPTSNNDTSNAVYMYANQNGPDIGIIYISPDTAFIANSGDAGYVFRVIDKDVNTNTNSNDGMLLGVRQSRGGLDVRSSIFPTDNSVYSLGSSSLKWNDAYASTFHGYLNGVAKDSQALAGSTLAQIIEAAGGVITITKNLKPTVDWLDTGIAGTALSTGTYIVQVSGLSSGNTPGIYSEIWSGVFSWYSGGTNSTNSDEILLHNAGHADNSNELYLRTIRQGATSGGVMKLQMAVKQASTSTVDVTFKFRKMI